MQTSTTPSVHLGNSRVNVHLTFSNSTGGIENIQKAQAVAVFCRKSSYASSLPVLFVRAFVWPSTTPPLSHADPQ
jgi:hypothetical protein